MSFNVDGLNYCELAHRIVRETPCSYCGAGRGGRCITRPASGWGTTLPPSASHRARIESYWKAQA